MRQKQFLFVVLFLLPSFSSQDIGTELLQYVRRIEGKTNEGRRAFIKQELRAMKVPFRTMPFDTTVKAGAQGTRVIGENIIVRMGAGKRHIVVGAHCDAVPNSPGANDNGGGVAVVLGLIRTLKDYPWNATIDFCFFDQEEVGLIGSAVYVRQSRDRDRHLAMVNLDVEGTGEEVYVGPVGGGDDDLVMRFVRAARDKTRFPFFEHPTYPSSDHLSFAAAKLENISISIVPKGDGERIVGWLSGENRGGEHFPKVLQVMHTPQDSSTYMSASALRMSYEFTKTVLMLLNESQK
ncbi:MAG TPA: M28 family metallopeptidase [Bacteroidota bacterium]|nr:M28 family metallopeptidase [Bacteroidota bacterium]